MSKNIHVEREGTTFLCSRYAISIVHTRLAKWASSPYSKYCKIKINLLCYWPNLKGSPPIRRRLPLQNFGVPCTATTYEPFFRAVFRFKNLPGQQRETIALAKLGCLYYIVFLLPTFDHNLAQSFEPKDFWRDENIWKWNSKMHFFFLC